MHLEMLPPPPSVASLVSMFYLYRTDATEAEGMERAGPGQIRFLLKGAGELRFHQGHMHPALPVMINGPTTGATAYRLEGPFHCLGIALRPVGWGALIRLPAHECADRVIDGGAVFDVEAAALRAQLGGLTTLDAMIACIEPFLLRHARVVSAEHVRLCETVRQWIVDRDLPGVQALFDAVPLSSRQVVRLVKQYYGAPPKLLERKFRALRAAAELAEGADARAVAERFYDQSHMIRELRHFTGHTPGTLVSHMNWITMISMSPTPYDDMMHP